MKSFNYTNVMAIVAISFMAACGTLEKQAVGLIQTDVEVTDTTDAGSDTADAPNDATATDAPKDATQAVVYKDEDGDGVTSKIDCDDKNKDIYPGAKEVCNGKDDDCDGETDEGLWESVFDDLDGDGYGDPKSGHITCSPKASLKWVSNYTDCNDSTEVVDGKVVGYFINPGREEVCGDNIDNNCNGKTDDGVTFYIDSDEDGFGDPLKPAVICGEKVAAMYVSNNTDCNDSNKGVHPGAEELCDEVDNNCNGLFDEDFPLVGDSCQTSDGKSGVCACTDDGAAEWCKPLPADPGQNPSDPQAPATEVFVPFLALVVEWPEQSTATVSYQVYTDADQIGKLWSGQAKSVYYTDSKGGFVAVEVDGISFATCGVRFNVAFNEPADSWLCEGTGSSAKLKAGVGFYLAYFDKPDSPSTVIVDQDDAYIWLAPGGGCSVLFANSESGKCALN